MKRRGLWPLLLAPFRWRFVASSTLLAIRNVATLTVPLAPFRWRFVASSTKRSTRNKNSKMETLTESVFLAWADRAGLCLDPRYPESAVLVFRPDPRQHRFWEVPAEPERRPYFILSLLELMGDWQACYGWRHMGSWPDSADPLRINDVVELQILKGVGLPLGTADVVKFERPELDKLVTLLFSTTVFGWSVGDDLYVVPEGASYILQTDHHNVIHVSFRNPADVDDWVLQMEERGFPLPAHVPDSTFKPPDWMKGDV